MVGEFDRIGDQIDQYLPEAQRVAGEGLFQQV